jgi:hypothetical protein
VFDFQLKRIMLHSKKIELPPRVKSSLISVLKSYKYI